MACDGAGLTQWLGSHEREEHILRFAPLVHAVVRRMAVVASATMDFDDLLGYGMIGLIEAVDRFDHARGVRFETFAQHRIRGNVLDALRKDDWVPRPSRRRARDIERTRSQLTESLGRPSTDGELAAALGLTVRQVQRALADAACAVVSLQQSVSSPNDDNDAITVLDCVPDDVAAPSQRLEEREVQQQVSSALRQLTNRERQVLSLHYGHGYTLRKIGEALALSESRCWQLRQQALRRLRACINGGASASPRRARSGKTEARIDQARQAA